MSKRYLIRLLDTHRLIIYIKSLERCMKKCERISSYCLESFAEGRESYGKGEI